MKLWIALILLTSHALMYAQEIKPKERLILQDSIVFVGIDFALSEFYHPYKTDISNYIRDKHCPAWGKIDDRLASKGDLRYDLQKKHVDTMTFFFDSSYLVLDSNWVTDKMRNDLTESQIKEHISKYPKLRSQGLGLVIFVDKINMKTNFVSLSSAYIDLANNEVIKIIRSQGAIGGGFGYTADISLGVENAYKDFITEDDKYLKVLKRSFK